MKHKAQSLWRRVLKQKGYIFTLLAFTAAYIITLVIFRQFDLTQTKIYEWISQFGPYAILVLFLIQLIGSLTPVPDTLIMAIGMILYGPILGGVIVWFGMYTAGVIHFFIAKKLGKEAIVKKIPDAGKLINKISGDNIVINLTYVRMFQIIAFDISSYVAGISGASFWQFSLSFLLGMIPHFVSNGFIIAGIMSDNSPLALIPGVTIFLAMFIIANWRKRSTIIVTAN